MARCAIFLMAGSACTKPGSTPQVIVEIPAGFSGNFSLEMGVRDAPPLLKRGDAYVVPAPRNGKFVTSTLLTNSEPTFRNSSEGAVWGYAHSIFKTGDGIPIGGKIEFFVGTRKEYEAEEGRGKREGRTTPGELRSISLPHARDSKVRDGLKASPLS
jgi:hypothetical protein